MWFDLFVRCLVGVICVPDSPSSVVNKQLGSVTLDDQRRASSPPPPPPPTLPLAVSSSPSLINTSCHTSAQSVCHCCQAFYFSLSTILLSNYSLQLPRCIFKCSQINQVTCFTWTEGYNNDNDNNNNKKYDNNRLSFSLLWQLSEYPYQVLVYMV